MEWTGLNELREMFLQFFESKEHLRLPSFPLVPAGDKSLLLINSGMAPMKKWFQGVESPPSHRVCTCQKCIRTPDIESVGITDRHGTYFEMLGNFSFQNYFKKEAIPWAWEFFTAKEWLDIPADKLHISVYLEDDDAWDIWTRDVGVPEDHMVRLGKADNFWEHGSGPCGPCSEIYYDRGEQHGCGKADCKPGCDCDRYIEVWNLVFTEFDSDGQGNYEKLAAPNIDTGMGLERLACVMQDAPNLFETDTIRAILQHVERLSGKTYGQDKKTDISIRVVTDHIRSTVFMVSDGILPSNEERGYVLRRLLRRAARHGRMLGIKTPFLAEVCDTVVQQNAGAYPELLENADYIKKTIAAEEGRFARTIDAGMERLNELLNGLPNVSLESIAESATASVKTLKTAADAAQQGLKEAADGTVEALRTVAAAVLDGAEAFKLQDTFGFPLDLTKEIAAERGIEVDTEGFEAALEEQRKKAREDRARRDIAGWEADLFAQVAADATAFVGYDELVVEAKVLALSDGEELLDAMSADGAEKEGVLVLLDRTPFYAESGGQVADTGFLTGGGARLAVRGVKHSTRGFIIHAATLQKGVVKVGGTMLAEVDEDRRRAIMRNHTSAHLLQKALREVLGDHVHQAGSYVDDERMRFDFTHFEAMTPDEVKQAEAMVNRKIFAALPVTVHNLPIEQAKQMGAMALFGEKYGDVVRVIDIEGWSTELCGGTHVSNTAQLGSFRILSESSVAAGVRRIESTTGYGVLRLLDEREEMLQKMAANLKVAAVRELPARLEALAEESRRLRKELDSMKGKAASQQAGDIFQNPVEVEGIKVFTAFLPNTNADALRKMCDMIRNNEPAGVGALIGEADGKMNLAVCCGTDAVARGLAAGNLAKAIAQVAGGSGGGKADFAMAGIKQPDKAQNALDAVPDIVKAQL
ncbi:alanine--tRNA ligase [Ruminococcaceae bacterium OttesenSCG-928-O06]|nr:alanine--tRNA ligase [Ruminococcaceae bacterium OttesenSCG-928-O06]